MREDVLGLGRSRREDAQTTCARMLDGGKPERRLPDARFALEYQCARSSPRLVDEGVEVAEFFLPTDDL